MRLIAQTYSIEQIIERLDRDSREAPERTGLSVNSGQPSGLRAILLGLVFYKTLKLTSTFTFKGTGLPSTVAGLNRYLLTASTAFSSKPLPKDRTTRTSCGVPCSSTTSSTTTRACQPVGNVPD